MPSKRTNDSVDRILEELNMEQAQAGLRDSVTDHQVDEILRSVGILSLPDEPLPEDKLSFPEGDAWRWPISCCLPRSALSCR